MSESEGYELGVEEGLRLGHATTLRTEEKGRATLAAYKAQIREARSVVLDLIASLPEDDRGRLAGVVAILTAQECDDFGNDETAYRLGRRVRALAKESAK